MGELSNPQISLKTSRKRNKSSLCCVNFVLFVKKKFWWEINSDTLSLILFHKQDKKKHKEYSIFNSI